MRILLYTHWSYTVRRAGAERYVDNMARFFIEQGHEVRYLLRHDVFNLTKQMEFSSDGIPSYIEHQDGDGYQEHLQWCDLVYSHLVLTNKAVSLAQKYGKPIFVGLHAEMSIENLDPSHIDLVLCNSQWVKEDLKKRNINPRRLQVLVPPFKVKDFAVDESKHDRYFNTHVNCHEQKGTPQALTLARQSKDEYPWLFCGGNYGTQLVPKKMIMDDRTPPREVKFADYFTRKEKLMCKEVIYPSNAEFHMPTSNIRDDIYARTKILWFLSVIDTWGMVALESFSSGIPVVAHYHKGFQESMAVKANPDAKNPSGGFLVDRDRGQVCYNLMVKLMEDKSFYDECSALARVRAHEVETLATTQLHELHSQLKEIVYG